MNNTLPQTNARLISLGLKAGAALKTNEVSIGIKHNTESAVTAALNGLIGTVDAFAAALMAKRKAFGRQATAFADSSTLLSLAVDVLTPFLGRRWSSNWTPTGFTNSLSIPTTLADRLETLRLLENYLKDHPEQQRSDTDPAKTLTAARVKAVRDELVLALANVVCCKSDTRKKKALRATGKNTFTKRLRGLINELDQLIPEDDSRWTLFGFNAPGETQAPEAVQDVTIEADGPNSLSAEWPDSARAERYLVEVLVVGRDSEFHRSTTVYDNDAALAVPAGARVKVRVIAANEAGESAPSAVVEITMPSLAEAA